METNEVSEHQVRLYTFLREHSGWCTAIEAAAGSKIASRTARAHLSKFVKAGIVDLIQAFPGHRYKFSPLAEKRNKTLVARLKQASEAFNGGT